MNIRGDGYVALNFTRSFIHFFHLSLKILIWNLTMLRIKKYSFISMYFLKNSFNENLFHSMNREYFLKWPDTISYTEKTEMFG